jgi:hypothetical protein
MDVSDLLSFKPETIPKRKQDDEDEGDEKSQAAASLSKRSKIDQKVKLCF